MMQKSPFHIHVSVRNQELKLRRGRKIIRRYPDFDFAVWTGQRRRQQ